MNSLANDDDDGICDHDDCDDDCDDDGDQNESEIFVANYDGDDDDESVTNGAMNDYDGEMAPVKKCDDVMAPVEEFDDEMALVMGFDEMAVHVLMNYHHVVSVFLCFGMPYLMMEFF